MLAVADDFRPDLGIFHRGGNHAGVAVVNAGHGIVQVGQVGDAGVDGGLGVVIVGIGVGDGNGAELLGLCHEFCGAGQLRGHIHNPNQTAAVLIQLPEAFKVRLLQVVRVLGAPLFIGEVGAFHLDAHQPGAALRRLLPQLLGGGEGLGQHLVGQGHGSGGKGGDAAARIEAGHGFQPLVVAVGEVSAGVSVAVDVHQAGNHGGALKIYSVLGDGFRQNRAENTVPNFKGTHMELEIGGKDAGIFVKHDAFLLFLY